MAWVDENALEYFWNEKVHKKKVSAYDTVDDMAADTKLNVGTTVIAAGATYKVEQVYEVAEAAQMTDPETIYYYSGDYFYGGSDEEHDSPEGVEVVNGFAVNVPVTSVSKDVFSYVTPEMFGAVGDGVTDDTAAWQSAVDVGLPVIAQSLKYKCETIHVTKNISIDCNNATFVCSAGWLFKCDGQILETLTGEENYTDGQQNYKISDNDYSAYSGFAMLRGTNNPFLQRDYYLGGFVCQFKDGAMIDKMPVTVENTAIDIINPITVCIKGIGDVISSNSNLYVVQIQFGLNCVVSDIHIKNANLFSITTFEFCYGCAASRIVAGCEYTGDLTYNYPIQVNSSCYTVVSDCSIFNEFWHCATTSGFYLSYHTIFRNCVFISENQLAFGTHSNSNAEMFYNCILGGAAIGEEAIVRDCTIVSRNTSLASGNLELEITCRQAHAGVLIDGLRFELPATTGKSGIIISASPTLSGLTGYIDNIVIKNVSGNITHSNLYFRELSDISKFTSIVLGDIILENVEIKVSFAIPVSSTIYNSANYTLTVINCIALQFKSVTNYKLVNLHIVNCTVSSPDGTVSGELRYQNVSFPNNSLWSPSSATLIQGSNVKCRRFNAANMNSRDKIILSAVYDFYNNKYFETIIHDGSGNPTYGRQIDNTGNVSVVTIT